MNPRKHYILLFLVSLNCYISHAQHLYSMAFTPTDKWVMYRHSIPKNTDSLVVKSLFDKYYYNQSTSDNISKMFYIRAVGVPNAKYDTLVSIDINTGIIIRDTVPAKMLLFPEFHNNKLYGINPFGHSVYDIATKKLTITTKVITDTTNGTSYDKDVFKSDFDHKRQVYILCKRNIPNYAGGTLQPSGTCAFTRYNVVTNQYILDTLRHGTNILTFQYTPTNDLIIFSASIHLPPYTGTYNDGLFSYDFKTKTIVHIYDTYQFGVFSAIDTIKNRIYFWSNDYPNQYNDSLYCYKINSKQLVRLGKVAFSMSNGLNEFFPTDLSDTTTDPITNIEQPTIFSNIKLYPNPTNDVLHIEGVTKGSAVQLFDMTGRLLKHQTLAGKEACIYIADFSAGTYQLTITTEEGTRLSKRFLKQ